MYKDQKKSNCCQLNNGGFYI